MNTFAINQYGVIVKHDDGTSTMIRKDSPYYMDAKNAVMSADWEGFGTYAIMDEDRLAEVEDDSPEFEADDTFIGLNIQTTGELVNTVKGMIDDEIISPEDLGLTEPSASTHEHDLSQWSGSPIFYPTREMAREQSDRWGMFWDYHDFGIASPAGYRYATVPRLSQAPTAPEGYDWVCLPREE